MGKTMGSLVALALLASAGTLCRAQEWTSAEAGGSLGASAAPPCAGQVRGNSWHRLWDWVTYHPIRSGHACSCRGCKDACQPHLYEYFLSDHPGCASCGVHLTGAVVEPPAQDWRSDGEPLPIPHDSNPPAAAAPAPAAQ